MERSRLWKSFATSKKSKTKPRITKSLDLLPREWPSQADDYELLDQVGKGAQCVVFRARCKPFDSDVAVRRLDLENSSRLDLNGLVREANLMRRFHHPAVLPLHAAFVSGKQLWMVTPFMGQGSVRSIMMRQFPQGLDEVVIATIMKSVLMGLQYMHRNGGIHRDVKADNILISDAGHVCLGDFGVAALQWQPEGSIIGKQQLADLRAKTFTGTPCWMAPEVMQQTDDGYTSSADIWSFGITMIELASGKPPMARAHPMRIVMDTINGPPPRLTDHPSGRSFSKAMKAVVAACLAKDPSQRPSAAALLTFRFFKKAKNAAFLEQHFMQGVPPPPEPSHRSRLQRGLKDMLPMAASGRLLSAWLFPVDLQQQQLMFDGLEEQLEEKSAGADTDASADKAGGPAAAAGDTADDTAAAHMDSWQQEPQPQQLQLQLQQQVEEAVAEDCDAGVECPQAHSHTLLQQQQAPQPQQQPQQHDQLSLPTQQEEQQQPLPDAAGHPHNLDGQLARKQSSGKSHPRRSIAAMLIAARAALEAKRGRMLQSHMAGREGYETFAAQPQLPT